MPHSVTTDPTGAPHFHVHRYSWPADSIEGMEEAVDELKTALIDAEVILSSLRDRQLGLLDTTDDSMDLLDRIHDQQFDDLHHSDGRRHFGFVEDDRHDPRDIWEV